MIISLLTAALLMPLVPRDTTITFGILTRDLTGDTIPEVITLTAVGRTIDDLAVSFTIRSSGRTLYTRAWRLARANYDGGGRPTEAERRARLSEYGKWFFGDTQIHVARALSGQPPLVRPLAHSPHSRGDIAPDARARFQSRAEDLGGDANCRHHDF